MSLNQISISIAVACSMTLTGQPQEEPWIEIAIPQEIQTNQQIIMSPQGWQSFDEFDTTHPLTNRQQFNGISVYDGHPKEMASLVPDVDKKLKAQKRWVSIWKLSPVSKAGSWIKCSYRGTRLSLCMPLAKAATEIRVTSSTEIPNNPYIIKVEYR
jgi:hypothetical protein